MIATDGLGSVINAIEFDHPFVLHNGHVVDSAWRAVRAGMDEESAQRIDSILTRTYAPDVMGNPDPAEPEVDVSPFWHLFDGRSGQQGRPMTMHDSEFVGNGLAERMAELAADHSVVFVISVIMWEWCEECEDHADRCDDSEHELTTEPEGWCVLYKFLDA